MPDFVEFGKLGYASTEAAEYYCEGQMQNVSSSRLISDVRLCQHNTHMAYTSRHIALAVRCSMRKLSVGPLLNQITAICTFFQYMGSLYEPIISSLGTTCHTVHAFSLFALYV